MPVFYILVVLFVVVLWFSLSFFFRPLGRFANRLYGDAKRAMTEEDETAPGNGANKEEKENKKE